MPYAQAERLAVLSPEAPRWDLFEELRDAHAVFERIGAYSQRAANLSGIGPAERVQVGRVSPDFLPITGVRLVLGRFFREDEFTPPNDRVALITDKTWRRGYAASPDILGHALTLDGIRYTVIGVLPPEFATIEEMKRWHELPFDRDVRLLVPLPDRAIGNDPASTDKVSRGLTILGRLRQGIALERSNRELAPILARELRYPFGKPFAFNLLRTIVTSGLTTQLAVLSLAVGVLLLVGCANVANLMLGRIEARRRELAVCVAIGSEAWRLVSSVLAETLLLSVGGGALGLLITWQAVVALKVLARGLLDVNGLNVDVVVLGFTCAVALAAGVVVGIGPALRYSRTDPRWAFQTASNGSGALRRRSVTSPLVALQVGLAVVLVVVGALLARTFVRSLTVSAGSIGTKRNTSSGDSGFAVSIASSARQNSRNGGDASRVGTT